MRQRTPWKRQIGLAITEWGMSAMIRRVCTSKISAASRMVGASSICSFAMRPASPLPTRPGLCTVVCLRKGFGITYYDPQYLVLQEYAAFINAVPVACHLTGMGFDVPAPADIGHTENDLPFIDLIAATDASAHVLIAAVNRHLTRTLPLSITIPGYDLPVAAEVSVLAYPDITARTSPAQPDRFKVERSQRPIVGNSIQIELPPFSVTWLKL